MRWVEVLVIVAALAMMTGLYLFVMRSQDRHRHPGRLRGQGTAALMGIDVNRAIVTTFGIGAAMAGAAGVLYALVFRQVTLHSGFIPGIKAFTAAVLGGIGNIPGAMLGGLFLGEIESIGPDALPHRIRRAVDQPAQGRRSPSPCWSSCWSSGRRASSVSA